MPESDALIHEILDAARTEAEILIGEILRLAQTTIALYGGRR